MSAHPPYDKLECIVDRWVNGRAVLRFVDGQEVIVARRFLPKNVTEGQSLALQILTQEAATDEREALARAILKEILSG